MAIDGDAAAGALTWAWQALVAPMSGGWTRREASVLAAVTTVPMAYLNGVWADGIEADHGTVAAMLDLVAEAGLPHCLQLRPGCQPSLVELAGRRGMTQAEDSPLMVLEDAKALGHDRDGDVTIRVLMPEEAGCHARLAAAGFEAPEEHFHQLMTPAVLRVPGVYCYVGEVNGEPVTTGFGITLGHSVGIFNIATPPAHRRHGYGAAVTARAVRDGLSSGARWAWLQSSPAGYSVYERLGFRTVESWGCWLADGR